MADRVAVLKDGRIQQIAGAREIYERPANLFAAGFVGAMNFIPVAIDGDLVTLSGGETWRAPPSAFVGEHFFSAATLAIRPERLSLAGRPGDLRLTGAVREVVYSGADTLVIIALPDGSEIRSRFSSADGPARLVGEEISLYCRPDAPLLYPGEAA